MNTSAIDLLRSAAGLMWPDFGPWAYDTWAQQNAVYFAGELVPGGILWGLTPHGHTLGHYQPAYNVITLHESLIESDGNPWGLRAWLGELLAADVLLHEMIHQRIHQAHGSPGGVSSHNNELWVHEVNRLAPMLGLPANAAVIKQKRIEGKVTWYTPEGCMTRAALAHWPHSARPEGYYTRNT